MCIRDSGQVYKAKACDFEDTKASVLGDFVPAKLGMDEGESAIAMAVTADYQGYMLFCFENGKVAKMCIRDRYQDWAGCAGAAGARGGWYGGRGLFLYSGRPREMCIRDRIISSARKAFWTWT